MVDFIRQIPVGDNRERDVCGTCGFINYDNPKIVAGAVVAHKGRVLLCRRSIEPGLGLWTLPSGFLESGERPEEGAVREALEEAVARIVLEGLVGIYTVKHQSQVQLFYRARFEGAVAFAAGEETLEAALFGWDEIPWEDMAFPSVVWALQMWHGGVDGMADLGRFSVGI